MKLIIDENISYAKEAFSQFGEVVLVHGRKITDEIVKDADALIVRSITNVNEQLLYKSKLKFVGTATIGTDHIDAEYLKGRNIEFADASGCNAAAVAEYVLTSLAEAVVNNNLFFKDLKIGVIGVGNIGSRISKYVNALGMTVIKNDPPLKRKTGDNSFKEIDDALKADIITFHVPLNQGGVDNTFHLIDYNRLVSVRDNCILINTSRGSVVDNTDLEKILHNKNINVILDVWENEPSIKTDLLKKAFLTSPHVAGYSLEGKVNGTTMIYSALCKFLNEKEMWKPQLPKVEKEEILINDVSGREEVLRNIFRHVYDLRIDNENMKKMLAMNSNDAAFHFDLLRKNYPLRREFHNYTVILPHGNTELETILTILRFNVKTY